MRKISILLFVLLAALAGATNAGAQQAQEGTGFMIIPAGDSIVLLGMVPPPQGAKGFRIYRQKEGGETKMIAEMPLWARNPDILVQELGEKDFADMAKRFGATTPAELMHKSANNPAINLTIVAMVPRYPKLLALFQDSYIYFDKDIEKDAKYIYVIKSVDASGAEKEVPTAESLRAVGGDKLSPAAPAEARAEAGDKEVKLYWKKGPGAIVGTMDAGYLIYRKEKTVDFRVAGYLMPMNGDDQAFFNTALENGVEYTYVISALNPAGVESARTQEFKVTPHDMVPPAAPKNLKSTFNAEEKKIKLTWDKSPEEDFAYYNLYRTEDVNKGDYIKLNDKELKAVEYVDETLKMDGKTYFYNVTAVDTFKNESNKVAPQYVTTPDMTPPPPPENIEAKFDKASKSVLLTWKPLPETEDFTVYTLFKGNKKEDLQQVTTVAKEKAEFKDPYAKEGTTVFYTVKAQDRASNVSEAKQILEVKIPDMTPPPTPFNLTVAFVPGEKGLHLKWNDVKAPDSKEYVVYRGLDEKGPFEKAASSAKAEYFDDGLKKGVLYWYRISQLDTSDNESNQGRAFSGKVIDKDPPAMPAELKAEFKKDGVHVNWKANTDDDLAGYNVYVVDLFRFTETLVTKEPIKGTAFLVKYTKVGNEGNVGVKIAAVDTSGNESKRTPMLKPK